MYKVNLQPTRLKELNDLEKKYQGDWKILRRLKCIELKNDGNKPRKIAEKLDVSQDSVTDRVKLFLEWWFDKLCNMDYDDRYVSAYKPYEKDIKEMIDKNCYNSYKELRAKVEEVIKVWNEKTSLYRFCKKKWIQLTKSVI